jgi:hypothetical protein
LAERRATMDEVVLELEVFLSEYRIHSYDGLLAHESMTSALDMLHDITHHRKQVDRHALSASEAIAFFSEMDELFINFIGQVTTAVAFKDYYADLAALISIGFVKNSLGQQRALGVANLGIDNPWHAAGSRDQFIEAGAVCKAHMAVFRGFMNANTEQMLESITHSAVWEKTVADQNLMLHGSDAELHAMDADAFFDDMTMVLEEFHQLQLYLEKDIHHFFQQKRDVRTTRWVLWMVFLGLLLLVNVVMYDVAVGRVKLLEKLDFYNVMRLRRKEAKTRAHKMNSTSKVSKRSMNSKKNGSKNSRNRAGNIRTSIKTSQN